MRKLTPYLLCLLLIVGMGATASQYISITTFGRSLVDDAAASNARTTLELGTMSIQAASGVDISGGDIEGVQIADSVITGATSVTIDSPLEIASGGTAATTAANARTALGFASGSYSPTLTNTTNMAASTTGQFNYVRVGSIVFVTGTCNVDPNLSAATVMKISLPIASNLGAAEDLSGTASDPLQLTGATSLPVIIGDATANEASVEWIVIQGTAPRQIGVSFSYEIL